MADWEEQENELLVLESIYDASVFGVRRGNKRFCHQGHFLARIEVPKPFHVLVPRVNAPDEMQEIALEHLPPIVLDFRLPPDYPSNSAPFFCLSCPWLTIKELEQLSQALDRSWAQDPFTVVLYRWMNLLDTEASDILQLKSSHSLVPLFKELSRLRTFPFRRPRLKKCYRYHGWGHTDIRIFKEAVDPQTLATFLTEYNSQEKRRLFDLQWLTCQVCLTSKQGCDFELMIGCDHPFCRDCLREHFRIQIESGCASQLRCPQEKCTTQVLPTQVKALVGDALGSRYEESLLSAYLDSQEDLTYCPRLQCQRPVVLDPGEQRAIRDEYLSATPAGKQAMEKRYGKRTLQLLVDESLTQDWMQENSKKCPHCSISIEKQDGCNKMTCWRCGTYFCWICMKALRSSGNPYQHFSDPSSGCFNKLFEGAEEIVEEDDHEFGEFL
nr:E3 ubiquitin-protein ligase RNF14-like isoform X2 [Rhipicephalus microplus]